MADYPVRDGNGNIIVAAAWLDAGKTMYPVKNKSGDIIVTDGVYPYYNPNQGGGVPANALTLDGQPLTLNDQYLTLTQAA